MRVYPYDSVMAARALGQGYAYLLTAMNHRGEGLGLAPSKLVGIGVHTVILDTVAYAGLCDQYDAGLFLHHVPKVEMKNDGSVMKSADLVARTGWEVDLPCGRTPAPAALTPLATTRSDLSRDSLGARTHGLGPLRHTRAAFSRTDSHSYAMPPG
ncbi:hypothetical protein O1L60_40065 [Streptomyces diastatochromogenes]|nr:hypothetical protein [Streptomyces diastatochromogenes]